MKDFRKIYQTGRSKKAGGGGKLGNQYLKVRHKIALSVPILKPIHLFSMTIYLWHKEN